MAKIVQSNCLVIQLHRSWCFEPTIVVVSRFCSICQYVIRLLKPGHTLDVLKKV